MPRNIVTQVDQEVKCSLDGCHEPTFRKGELCYDHFIAEAEAAWDDWDAERRTCLEGVGYVFGDPVGEVLA